jgi:hypothetical protein
MQRFDVSFRIQSVFNKINLMVRSALCLTIFIVFGSLSFSSVANAMLGTELAPLFQLVAGQVQELQKLSEHIGLAKDQQKLLQEMNQGIDKAVSQIQALETLITRAQGLEPKEVRSLADLNELIVSGRSTQSLLGDLLQLKISIAEQAIEKGALQSDTTYRMGQEMIATGSQLAQESETASPGRAAQITAASSSAQMLSQGVELQTLSQMVQLQAMQLELQRSAFDRELREERMRNEVLRQGLKSSVKRKRVIP